MIFQQVCTKAYHNYWLPRKYGGTFQNRLGIFQQNETKELHEIEQLRWLTINRILTHAEKHVPYYRKVFAENQVRTAETWDYSTFLRIPLLQRSDLQNHLDELVAENIDRRSLRRSSTGGSTGQPTPFYHDREYEKQNAALIFRNLFWTGWNNEKLIVKIWGSVADLSVQQRVTEKVTNYLKGVTVFPAYETSPEYMIGWAQKMQRIRPYLVEGYAQVLVTFAKFCQEANLRLDNIGVHAVVSTAEMLFPHDREILEGAFGCRVFNRYGHRELSTIAQECRHGNMHVNEDWLFAEVVDENGQPVPPGEIGQVVVTGFFNDGMPFVRYATQDLASITSQPSPCPCGLPFRILDNIQGRIQDLIILPGGAALSGIIFPAVLKYYDIIQFQVVQSDIHNLDIFIIRGENFTDADLQKIRLAVERYTPGIACHYHDVDQIPVPPSGKHRYTISNVPSPGWSKIVSN
jgi:phenylacetate-CoA ligase